MKISLNWLNDFIEINEKNNDLIKEIITTNVAEVETMEQQGDHLENIVVGKIVEIKPHPNADSLKLTIVNDGENDVQVVCGGSNLKKDMLVVFAKLGAVVKWHGSEVVKMEKAKIRGEESFGMICGADEVGIEELFPKKSEKEIVDLSHLNAKPGTPLKELLGLDDIVLDIDNHAITNRSDLFSHKGFAREFVANNLAKWKKVKKSEIELDNSKCPIDIEIKDTDVCSRYLSVYITGIEINESPDWMKKRLSACGIRPISNIVDITNYVMLELGMPLHAFDTEKVKNKNWVMRKSKKGEKVTTLDGKEHELGNDVIVIDDGKSLIDLCGIMGGLNSGIDEHTKKILLHAPVYNPTLIRRGMRGLGHISDASIIYEKGVDPMLAEEGLMRAIELILELCPNAKIASKITDIQNKKLEKRVINLRVSQIKRLVGIEIKPSVIEKILSDLGYEFEKNKEQYSIKVPSWRYGDTEKEADIIEDIARIYGYSNIPEITPETKIDPTQINKKRDFEKNIKNKLASFGYNEIYTFAFLGPELMKKCEMIPNESFIEIENPISSDMSLMKQSLLPMVLENISNNLRYKNKFNFELNPIYIKKTDEIHDEKKALIIATVNEDFRVLQGAISELGFVILPLKKSTENPCHHPGRVGEIALRGKKLGFIYEVHPTILKNFDIKAKVTVAEINTEEIDSYDSFSKPKYEEFSKYPSVSLDISILIPKKNLSGDYLKMIEATDKNLISSVNLIDEYQGDKIANDKRALTYSITYQTKDRTLTEGEVNNVHSEVLKKLKANGAEIR